MEPRKYSVGIGIWRDGPYKTFSDKIEQFSYTDYAAGSSDAISSKVNNFFIKCILSFSSSMYVYYTIFYIKNTDP